MTEPVLLWPDGAPGAAGDGPEDRPRLTPYLLDGTGPHPMVLVCPGGGYNHRAPHEGEPVARWLNDIGAGAAVLDYRVAPYRYPAALQDALRAVRLVRSKAAEWRVDARRVAILGFSAGGHVAASASTLYDEAALDPDGPVDTQPSRPDASILCYPVITFSDARHDGSMRALLGPERADDPAWRERLSLERRVTPRTPPAFLWATADDPAVPVVNSLRYAEALAATGVPVGLHVFPHGPHGVGLGREGDRACPAVTVWTDLCEAWLRGVGFLPAAG